MQADFRGKRCLVTGGAGFIGGRLVEHLAAEGAEVRVLVRDLSKASRIGRYPVELVRGDVGDEADVRRAVEGHEHVFHCAYGNAGDEAAMRRVTVDGTGFVAEACLDQGARLVHVSTVAVYGSAGDGALDESVTPRPAGDFYAETKLEAEQLVLEAAAGRGLAASVIQPTVVYGPFAPAWTVRILNELRTGRVILVDGGEGLCNVVYVDDVVQGMRLAALRDEALGEAFLISGPEPVTWRAFYAAYEDMLGLSSHVELTAAQAHKLFDDLFGKKHLLREGLSIVRESGSLRRRIKTTSEVQTLLRAARVVVPQGVRRSLKDRITGRSRREGSAPAPAAPEKPIHPMAPAGIEMARSRTAVKIDKARSLLGYEPAFDFETGMARVAEWARWAGLAEDALEGVGT
jgi:nucleoside-diphosphate-sugar epimerase